ncbi:MAG TPA: hypothetical protein VLT88_03395, partial [Desulfosarcina sp.]|nr:hypothetical protein [Desulfosarcina sp.]
MLNEYNNLKSCLRFSGIGIELDLHRSAVWLCTGRMELFDARNNDEPKPDAAEPLLPVAHPQHG